MTAHIGSALALALIAIASCDSNPAGLTVGMRGGFRSLGVVHLPCPGELVVSVAIVDAHGENPGGSGDSILWRISAEGGAASLPQVTIVGQVPSGFTTDVPFKEGLANTSDLSLLLETKAKPDSEPFTIAMGFSPGQLKPDEVLTDEGAYLSQDAFDERAKQACP